MVRSCSSGPANIKTAGGRRNTACGCTASTLTNRPYSLSINPMPNRPSRSPRTLPGSTIRLPSREIGDWTRFTGSTIASYLGLGSQRASPLASPGTKGPSAKAGNTYARKLLIEAAWQHRRPYARPGERLLRQLELVAPATRIRPLEGNHPFHRKWEHFDERHKMSVKANTAIDRELACWCWSLAAPL